MPGQIKRRGGIGDVGLAVVRWLIPCGFATGLPELSALSPLFCIMLRGIWMKSQQQSAFSRGLVVNRKRLPLGRPAMDSRPRPGMTHSASSRAPVAALSLVFGSARLSAFSRGDGLGGAAG
jgi:hypothetical protein